MVQYYFNIPVFDSEKQLVGDSECEFPPDFPPISWLRKLPSKLFADAWRTVRERWLCGSFRWVKSLSQVTQRTIYSFMSTTVIIAPLCFIWDHLSSWIPKVACGLPLAFNFPPDILVFEVRRIALKTLSCISEEGNAQAEMFADMFCYRWWEMFFLNPKERNSILGKYGWWMLMITSHEKLGMV